MFENENDSFQMTKKSAIELDTGVFLYEMNQ